MVAEMGLAAELLIVQEEEVPQISGSEEVIFPTGLLSLVEEGVPVMIVLLMRMVEQVED